MLAMVQAMATSEVGGPMGDLMLEPKIKEHNPWNNVQLTKAERREKTYEQMQELRRSKWESTHD